MNDLQRTLLWLPLLVLIPIFLIGAMGAPAISLGLALAVVLAVAAIQVPRYVRRRRRERPTLKYAPRPKTPTAAIVLFGVAVAAALFTLFIVLLVTGKAESDSSPAFIAAAAVGFFGAPVALAVLGAVLKARRERMRGQAFQRLARERGLRYAERDTEDRAHRFSSFRFPFGQGHSRVAEHVLVGTHRGVPFEIFTYAHTVGGEYRGRRGGRSSQKTHRHRVVAVPMAIAAPGLSITAERWKHKVIDTLGAEDIDFESAEFSRRFWVQCPDRRFAYDIFHPEMIEFFLAGGSAWSWTWNGTWLVAWSEGRVEIPDVLGMVEMAAGFSLRLPRHRMSTAPSAAAGGPVTFRPAPVPGTVRPGTQPGFRPQA